MDPAYIGAPYFEPGEVQLLKLVVVSDGGQTLESLVQTTLDEKVNRRKKKRVESGDLRVCAAHDLAPVFKRCLGSSPRSCGRTSHS